MKSKLKKSEKRQKTLSPLDRVLAKFQIRSLGDGGEYKTLCPAHNDRIESLSISEGDDGRVLMHCHAGCGLEDILSKKGLAVSDLFVAGKTVTYTYRTKDGEIAYQAVRKPGKKFYQRRPDPKHNGEWINNLKGVDLVVYHLDKIQGKKAVFVVEGEKDVETLRALGLDATTSPAGAGKWRDEYAKQLVDAGVERVAVLADNDEAGRQHQVDVASSCQAAGLTVFVVELPDLPKKGDVTDWLNAGHTKDDLIELVKATPRYSSGASEATTAPASAGLPDLPEAAYLGIAKQYADLMSGVMEPPRVFFYFAYLTHLGAAINGHVVLASTLDTEPRLYTLLLADTGDRKSAALEQTNKFFALVTQHLAKDVEPDEDDEPTNIYAVITGGGSAEGIAKKMMAFDERHPCALIEMDEFRQLVGKMKIENASLLDFFCVLFERKVWENPTSGPQGKLRLRNACLSLLTATTWDTFDKIFDSKFNDQGFLNRLWLVPGKPTRKVYEPDELPEEFFSLAEETARLVRKIRTGAAYKAVRTPAARKLGEKWYAGLSETPKTKRLDTYEKRLAMLLAVSAGKIDRKARQVVLDDTVTKASLAMVEWQRQVREQKAPVVADNAVAAMSQKIISTAKRWGKTYPTERDLATTCRAYQTGYHIFDKALDLMVKHGHLTPRDEKNRSGVRVRRYEFVYE